MKNVKDKLPGNEKKSKTAKKLAQNNTKQELLESILNLPFTIEEDKIEKSLKTVLETHRSIEEPILELLKTKELNGVEKRALKKYVKFTQTLIEDYIKPYIAVLYVDLKYNTDLKEKTPIELEHIKNHAQLIVKTVRDLLIQKENDTKKE